MGDTESFEYLKIFVGGMSLKTDEDLLRDYFGTYGELKEVHVMKDTYNRESKGYGFVTFSSEDGYEKCLDENPHTIDGKLVEVKKAVPAKNRRTLKTKKIFVGGLHDTAVKEDLEEALVKLDMREDLDYAKIMTQLHTEKPRGFAFIVMKSCEAADKLAHMGHMMVKDRQVELKHAISKEEMQSRKKPSQNSQEERRSGRSDPYHGRGLDSYYGRGSEPYYGRSLDPYFGRSDDYDYSKRPSPESYGYRGYPGSRGYYDDRSMMSAYTSYGAGYGSRYSGGYGAMYSSYGYSPSATSSMGSYSQSSSSYGPSRGRYSDSDRGHSYHPYTRR